MSTKAENARGLNPSLIFLLVLVVAALFLFLPKLFGGPNIESLRDTALNGSTTEQKIRAAQELSKMGVPALEAIRDVAEKSDLPGIVSVCILAVSRHRDYQCMDLLLSKLDDESPHVRASASKALEKMLGRDYHFPIEADSATRAEVKAKIVADWELYEGSELFEHNKNRFEIIEN